MKSKQVLVVGPNVDMKIHGGIVTHMKLLLSLSDETDFDFKMQSFTLGDRKIVGERIGIQKLLTSFLKYIWVLYITNFDVVHINASMKNGSIVKYFFALFITKLFFKRCIFQFHGGNPEDISDNRILILKAIVNLSDKILVLTNEQMEIKYYLEKVKWAKIEKIPNFMKEKEVIANKRKDDTKTHFLFIGRAIREKGIFEILRAAKKMMDEGLDFQVDIVGDGTGLNEMKKNVKILRLEKKIIFYGFINDEKEKDNIFSLAHVMIFPSYYKEGFPYSVLEAMLFKMPIISTGVGVLSDVIVDNKNGFLIPEKNYEELFKKMRYFVLNSGEIERMGSNSFYLLKAKFSKDKMKQKFGDLYHGLL